MPVFTSPLSVTDGTTAEVFTLKDTIQQGQSIVTTYANLAAPQSQKDTIKTKFIDGAVKRSVVQRNETIAISDGSLPLATFNISAVYHAEHDVASLTKLGKQLVDATSKTDFWSKFLNQISA